MYGNLKTQLQTELDEIRAAGLYKGERVIDSPQAARVGVGRKAPVLNMCANNYLGLANHPDVTAAARAALRRGKPDAGGGVCEDNAYLIFNNLVEFFY